MSTWAVCNSCAEQALRMGHRAARLVDDKLSFALVADLQEGLAGHVLDAGLRLVHELNQLVHHRLQELPVVAQEARVLAHHIPVHIPVSALFAHFLLMRLTCNMR